MSTFITASKLVSETITLEVNFLSRMRLGEFLQTFTVTRSVFTGADSATLPVIVSSSLQPEFINVQLEGGVAGVVYKIDVAGRTNLNNVLVQEVKLAVLSGNEI
jgi:hypothetical protein